VISNPKIALVVTAIVFVVTGVYGTFFGRVARYNKLASGCEYDAQVRQEVWE